MSWLGQIVVVSIAMGMLQLRAETLKPGDSRLTQSCGFDSAKARSYAGTWRTHVVQDPAIHRTWRIERDSHHPEWPARLVQISDDQFYCSGGPDSVGIPARRIAAVNLQSVIVHKGDVLVISEDTATLHAEFDGFALSNGSLGDSISVRLRFAATVVRARITEQRRAVLEREGAY
jgi:hypothetical protein